MPKAIRIVMGGVTLNAELNDSETARAIAEALPIEASANRWGDEFYFSIPVQQPPAADARAEMSVGELAYWPPGEAFCIFFGPTPVSRGEEPRAASPVNPVGHLTDGIASLPGIPDGAAVRIEPA